MDPAQLKFAATHEWVDLQDGVATIGLSKFAVEQLSDLITIDLLKVGAKVAIGKSFGEIESVKSVSDLYAPVAGEVIEVNAEVVKDIQVLATDPHGKGWLIKVKASGPLASDLMDLDAYERQVAEQDH